MHDPVNDSADAKEEPLDPAALALQQKMRKLLLGSSLVMIIGLVAVFAAIFYKVTSGSAKMDRDNIAATVAVGPDAQVLDVEMVDGKLLLLINENGAQSLVYIDPVTGKKIGRTDFMAR